MAIQVFDKDSTLFQRRRQQYQEKKLVLQKTYKDLLSSKPKEIALRKNSSNLFRNRKNKHNVDLRNFNQVISIDPENLIAEIEGMTPYEKIVDETLKYGFLPTVVPELKSITIGGALTGGGIESSSFRYGLVHETILEFETLLGDGRVITCRPDNEYSDLFYAFPNSYGTLGYALKVTVKLIPSKKFVKLSHHHFSNPIDYFNKINEVCQQNRNTGPLDYIDGVIFDPKNLYLTLGEFTDTAPETSDYTYLNIYYKTIRQKKQDFLSARDYIWRWDSDWFWCSKHFYMQNFLLRLLLGKFLLKSTVFWKIRKFFNSNAIAKKIITAILGPRESIIQDIQLPIENATAFLEFYLKDIHLMPIWICPTQAFGKRQYDLYKMDSSKLYVNFGFWDAKPSSERDGFYNRKIEERVNSLKGNKSLYSNVFYTQDEFWSIYEKSLYMALKNKYDPNHRLKDLYEKTTEK